MTEAEQPDTPPLTRKQMRDLRNTGATPVVAPSDTQSGAADATPAPEPPTPPAAPIPRAAVPVVVPDAPVPDLAVDLGVSPLTRRQARQQERIRTASVPVITPDVVAAHTAAAVPAPAADSETAPEPLTTADAVPRAEDAGTATSALRDLFADAEPDAESPSESDVIVVDEPTFEPVDDDGSADEEPSTDAAVTTAGGDDDVVEVEAVDTADEERPVVSPLLGAGLFADEASPVDLPPSFDDLLAQGSTGSVGTASALILSPPTGDSPIVAPVTATGEVLITGTFNLPEGLGSLGHAPGTADGREADAVLVDGELPAHSSPTPIAASAAISTVKTNGDVIKPPAPEKGSRLMMWLAITAGVLALALVGVLILAFVNGVF